MGKLQNGLYNISLLVKHRSTLLFAHMYLLLFCHFFLTSGSKADVVRCELQRDSTGEYRGTCQIEGQTYKQDARLQLYPDSGHFVWRGTVLESSARSMSIAISLPSEDLYSTGAIQTRYGWFKLSSFELSDEQMNFSYDWFNSAPPTSDDKRIIVRALEILSDSSAWNNEDDGDCESDAELWSLRCALFKACTEVTDYLHNGQRALGIVRNVINQTAEDRSATGLRGYNNSSETSWEKVQRVLWRAKMIIDAKFNLRSIRSMSLREDASTAVSLGDIDGDGDLDIVIANGRHWPEGNAVFTNSGKGAFTKEHPLGINRAGSYEALFGDFDGDGDLDIAVGNDRSPNTLWFNNGDGSYRFGGSFGAPESPTRDLAIADLNGDNALDIVVLNRDTAPIEICFNDTKGGFEDCVEFGLEETTAIKVATADVNGDNYVDIVLANERFKQNYVYLNDGRGGFTDRRPFGSGSDDTRTVAVGDLNNDGHQDIVTGNIKDFCGVYFGDGKGNFDSGVKFGSPKNVTFYVALGDLDADGDLDIVIANAWTPNSVFLNDGDGRTFKEVQFCSSKDHTYGIALGDLNGDGLPDIVEANDGTVNNIYITELLR